MRPFPYPHFMMQPTFFDTPSAFRSWLGKNHQTETELLVGFHKKDSGLASITWPESVDVALCFGWIDGVRRRIDDRSYSIRFTPRKRTSTWSVVNIRRIAELTRSGLMHAAGLKAFEQRSEAKSGIYAYENAPQDLSQKDERTFRSNRKAWRFFSSQPPSYRRLMIHWIVNAKKEQTRTKRLSALIHDSEEGRRLNTPASRNKE
ncbi:MAG TPA: YdeI/OmpD-associated family protein [Thermoanaerobaculia bacterium]|nr:YdeI/OmpD-associated family protein [Thermoanaerobaculia bacterium]